MGEPMHPFDFYCVMLGIFDRTVFESAQLSVPRHVFECAIRAPV